MRSASAAFGAAVALVAAVAVAAPGWAAHDRFRADSPYSCGYCLFEVPLSGGPMRILWGDPQVASIDDLDPARGQIVFTAAGPGGVYVAGLDGTRARKIADGDHGLFSPDGTEVAYYRPDTTCQGEALAVVGINGQADSRVSPHCAAESAAWSPDSRRLAFFDVAGLNADAGTLTVADANGGDARVLATAAYPRDPAWSSTGDRISFDFAPAATPPSGHGVSAGGSVALPTLSIAIVGLDGTSLGRVDRAERAVWDPRGKGFAFGHADAAFRTGHESFFSHSSLAFASPDGRTVQLLHTPCCGLYKWFPRGDRLAYVSNAGQIVSVGRDGGGARQLTHILRGGTIDDYWISPSEDRLYVLWEFTDVDASARKLSAAAPRGQLTDIRICSGAYADAEGECQVDQHGHPLPAYPEVRCSVHVAAVRSERFTARLLFDGMVEQHYSLVLHGLHRRAVAAGFAGLDARAPAGRYSCDFRLGPVRASATAVVPGRRIEVPGDSACSVYGSGNRICSPVQPEVLSFPQAVSCSAVVVGQRGRTATTTLERREGSNWATVYRASDKIGVPIAEIWAYASASPGPFFASGDYRCRFAVDRVQVAVKAFTVRS